MPRGSSGGASSSSSGTQASFRGAEQSLNIMRQVKSYFIVGMDHVLEVATDMAEYSVGTDDEGQARKLRQIMLNYIRMERDMDHFMSAAEDIMAQGEVPEERGALEKQLQLQIKDLGKKNSDHQLKKHEKYTELEQKIWDCQHPDAVPGSFGASAPIVEEDIEMTQTQVNTKCPYTGKEMDDPVRNVNCKHSYDRAGITYYMKQRGKRAMCPVGGCKNTKPIIAKDLEDHKEMRRYIQNKRKRPHPSSSASAGTSRDTQPSQASGTCDTQPSASNAVVIHEG